MNKSAFTNYIKRGLKKEFPDKTFIIHNKMNNKLFSKNYGGWKGLDLMEAIKKDYLKMSKEEAQERIKSEPNTDSIVIILRMK